MPSDELYAISGCRICGSIKLVPILSLGELYVSDFLSREQTEDQKTKAPLELVLCGADDGGCGLLQLKHTYPHELMYRNYWYLSGINQTMRDELRNIVENAESLVSLGAGDLVIDIGSNDGTLLRNYKADGLYTIGFEPARNIAEKYGMAGVTKVFTDFFDAKLWAGAFGNAKAKVITAIAMFYDLNDPNRFTADVRRILDDEGVFVIQMTYLPSKLKRNAFDGIVHEHLEYYALGSLENLLGRHNLEVFDLELRDINEGSFRVYIRHKGKGKTIRAWTGADSRVRAAREAERKLGLGRREVYDEFARRVESIKSRLCGFIDRELKKGKKIYVYGASTKGNTLLQYFNLDHTKITAAAERNPDKWGKKTIATRIPIISEEQARIDHPDYFLILPWHFLKEFREREGDYFMKGGKFIVPLPEFRIIDN